MVGLPVGPGVGMEEGASVGAVLGAMEGFIVGPGEGDGVLQVGSHMAGQRAEFIPSLHCPLISAVGSALMVEQISDDSIS